MWDFVFSANGEHVAYTARISGKTCLVIDNKATTACYQNIVEGSLQIDSLGARIAYIANQGNKQFAVVGGHRYSPYDEVSPPLVRSKDWSSVAYAARTGKTWDVTFNGQSSAAYEQISAIILSPSGRRLAFVGQTRGKMVCVIDGVKGGFYDFVGTPRFSADDKRTAYTVRSAGRDYLVLDGRRQSETYGLITDFLFSPDSSRLAIAVRDDGIRPPQQGSAYVVSMPGGPGKHFDAVSRTPLSSAISHSGVRRPNRK